MREWFGHVHIPQSFAQRINQFTEEYLNPYFEFPSSLFVLSREGGSAWEREARLSPVEGGHAV